MPDFASVTHAVQRAIHVLRKEGARSFCFKLLSHVGYRRLIVFERSLEIATPVFAPHLKVSIRLLGADEKENYLAFRPETPASLVTDRLGSGHLCFAARYQGRIIGATWATTKRAWIDYLDYDLPLRAGEVYTYDGFTLPEYRGHGVAPAISVHMLRYFAEAGYQRATRTILPENSASLRARKKAGYTPVGVMGYMRIGPWTRHFFSKIGSGNSTTAISW